MLPPPPARSQYSVLIRVRVRVRVQVRARARLGARGRGRVRTRLRVRVGFEDSAGVQSGQKFPLGGFGAHGALGAFGAHGLVRAAPLATNCWPEAPWGGGGGVGVLGPTESPPPHVCNACLRQYLPVFHLIWVLGARGGGGVSQGIGTQPAYAAFQPIQLKNRSFRNLSF